MQLAILPMFLFSATFYPLSTYPQEVQWVVQATPLYHGVELERALLLGELTPAVLGHVGFLVALGLGGMAVAAPRRERLLKP